MRFKAGRFEIDVWEHGSPIWCIIYIDGQEVRQVEALDLPDLAHVIDRARAVSRQKLAMQGRREERDL